MLHRLPFILSFIVIIASLCTTAEAKSVYAFTDHSTGTVKVYQIEGNQLGNPYAQASFNHGEAIDLTVDSQMRILFMTHESGDIVCADADTLSLKAVFEAPQMAGIVADEARQRVYAVQRDTSNLYVCRWDGSNLVLVDIVTLANLGGYGALGISLDKLSRRLYVSDDTNMVRYYDVDDPCWAHLGSRNVGVPAMDIDVDPYNNYLYVGGYQESGGSPRYLVKHNLSTDVNSNTQQDMGTTIIGVAVDPYSSLVYVTTTDPQVRVYDCSTYPFTQTYSVSTGSSSYPVGICVESVGKWLNLTKSYDVDDTGCVFPGDEINYTIAYDSNGPGDTNAILIDHLPVEVDYNSSTPEGNYDPVARTVTWDIRTIPPVGNGSFLIKVNVNDFAAPSTVFTNTCELRGNLINMTAKADLLICFWNPGVIYVDCNSTGGKNTGMFWQHAFLDLQNALEAASFGYGSEIWVAKGTYNPSIPDLCNPSLGPTFKLINNIPVYGHFAGSETSLSQRNLNDTANETILSGAGVSAQYVITASGFGQNNILDGFTITGGSHSLITIPDAHLAVSNCFINGCGSSYSGITEAGSGSAQIFNCIIFNNGRGIFFSSSSSDLTVIARCKIFANSSIGICLNSDSDADIRDNWIYRNGNSGIYVYPTIGSITIRNNTIFKNKSYGIICGSSAKPIITSSIVWGNSPGDISRCSGSYLWLTANGDPCFVNADGNDFHLRPQSLCIDAGDPDFRDFNNIDIDGQRRIMDGDHDCIWRTDIGADEFGWPMADFNKDDIADFFDFAIFANSWHAIDPAKSFDGDNDVDIVDLAQFCESWLWYRAKPDLDRNHSVDFSDFAVFADSWKTFNESRSLDENCDVDIYDLVIFSDHWLSYTD